MDNGNSYYKNLFKIFFNYIGKMELDVEEVKNLIKYYKI
jgi:hypothetical protein